MADITKKEIEELLSEQTTVILGAVDERFEKMDAYLNRQLQQAAEERAEIRRSINELALTLDEFMKRVIHQDEEIVVLNAKVDKITAFLKQKFGVEISAQ